MYFSLVAFICTIVFVLVQCNDHHMTGELRFDNAVADSREQCALNRGKYNKDLRTSMQNTACKPHYRHVLLKAMPGEMFTPPIVSVPRCDGLCAAGLMCQPVKSRMVRVPVNVVNTYEQMMKFPGQCTYVEVEEHVTCTCRCDVKKSDCDAEKQEYMKSKCKCMCKNLKAKNECEDGSSGMMWNEEKCSCDCIMQNKACTNGRKWNEKKCMCTMEWEARRRRHHNQIN